VTKPARQYAPILLERILDCMRPRYPQACLSGFISLETRYSLEVIADALSALQDKGLVRPYSDEEKQAKGLRLEYDLYTLTELGYKSSSKV
jgi:hypothetical protein